MTLPSVVMCSMWRNDAWRDIGNRVRHLLAKAESYPNVRWLWVVGDSTDETAAVLREQTEGDALRTAKSDERVTILEVTTGIAGNDPDSCYRRLSLTANHYLKYADGMDYILIHESDLISPPNLVNLLVAHAESGRCPIAGWPTLEIKPGVKVFYDRFAYRKDGQMFSNHPPYHPCYQADKPFVVDSAGSVLMFHAEDAGECIMSKRAILDLCWHLRELGRDIWVDPTIEIVQPRDLWQHVEITKEYA